jgi:outer membrane lipoprotein-sorting protein
MISGASLRTDFARATTMLLLAGALHAADAPAWDFARLMAQLAQVQTSRARYTEVRHVAMLKQPLELSGTLSYSRPARIEKIQTGPVREIVRVDGETLTVEREGKTRSVTLRNSPLVGTLVESLRATLAGDGSELQRLFSVSMEGPKERWILKLTPREIDVAGVVAEIGISGSGTHVVRIEIQEPSGDRSVMTIKEES